MPIATIVELAVAAIEAAGKLSGTIMKLINEYKGLSETDKTALIAKIRQAQAKVTEWE